MSSRASRGYGHRVRPRAEPSFMRSIPILEISEIVGTPTAEMRSQDEPIGDDPMSQAMLLVLRRIVGSRVGPAARGSVKE